MKAITVEDLQEWFETEQAIADDPEAAYMQARCAEYSDHEAQLIRNLPASKRLDYLVHMGELSHCPRCGAQYVETSSWDYPDMVGETVGTTWECCGYEESYCTGLEYRDGKAVDVR